MLSYKRGRNMLDSRPGQILGLPAPANADEAAQHRRIFEKVWSQVERIIHDFRQALEQKLLDPSLPSDETEKIIECVWVLLVLVFADDLTRKARLPQPTA